MAQKMSKKILRPQYQTKYRPLGKVIQFNHPNPHPIYSNNAQNEYSNDAMKIFSNSVGGRPKDYRLSFGTTSRTSSGNSFNFTQKRHNDSLFEDLEYPEPAAQTPKKWS